MLIRTKIILGFTILATGILIAISVSIFIFYSLGKDNLFYSRLKKKAISTAKVFAHISEMDEIALHSLDQQREAVYDEGNKLIYSSGYQDDFFPTRSFLNEIRSEKEKLFSYTNSINKRKGGVGICYTSGGKKIIVIVTGLDKFGIERIDNLRKTLIICDILGLSIIVLSAFIFSKQALKPVKKMVEQVRSINGTQLNTRLDEGNRKDEIASLAIEFNKLLDRVEKTVESQTSFVSHASHELRTPLANILGILETSFSYDKDLVTVKENINTSINQLKKVISLTNGLLNLAKIENDQALLTLERVNLLELLLDCINSIKRNYHDQNIELSLKNSSEEPNDYIVNGNKHLLFIAITNVIDNACKYSDNSKVLVSLYSNNFNSIILSTSDSGYGINPKDLDNIFTPLYRGNNIKNIPGFGIGLALVHKIIKFYNGDIQITSIIDRGTTITLVFPTNL